ncbi:hypothetical protein L195_g044015 [Trifolium pratense]|uniref:Uncharacterized protein n=1 Tax=Trifolium pratense TaxID=57577 RepID=A0A2K3MAV4_TRIPR|nr:hypothetical protein L195_g044015 [Trifolium pratense]
MMYEEDRIGIRCWGENGMVRARIEALRRSLGKNCDCPAIVLSKVRIYRHFL